MVRSYSGHHTHEITGLAFADTAERFLVSVASDKSVRVWDTRTGEACPRPIAQFFCTANVLSVCQVGEKCLYVGDSVGNLCQLQLVC